MKEPDLLNSVVTILIRFCTGQYAETANIEQMFHQINVREVDQDVFRFLWPAPKPDKLDDYKMAVHHFCKNNSPCCTNYSLRRYAID